MQQTSRYCKRCGKQTLHAKPHVVGMGWGIFLSIITCGLFLVFWILMTLLSAFRPYRCQICGKGRLT